MNTRLKTLAKAVMPLVAGAATFGAACTSQAALVIDESFTGANDTLPANWTSPGTAVNVSIQGDRLRMYRGTTTGVNNANNVQAAYYTGTGLDGSMTGGKIADFSASVTINTGTANGGNTSYGLLVRDNNTNFAIGSGYYVAIKSDNTFGVWTNTGADNIAIAAGSAVFLDGVSGDRAAATVSLSLNTDYIIEVLAVGSNITASLWATDNGAKTGTALAQLDLTNVANQNAGYIGLHMGPGNTNQTVYFDNLKVQSIPEPATALLLLPAGAYLLYRKRRAV